MIQARITKRTRHERVVRHEPIRGDGRGAFGASAPRPDTFSNGVPPPTKRGPIGGQHQPLRGDACSLQRKSMDCGQSGRNKNFHGLALRQLGPPQPDIVVRPSEGQVHGGTAAVVDAQTQLRVLNRVDVMAEYELHPDFSKYLPKLGDHVRTKGWRMDTSESRGSASEDEETLSASSPRPRNARATTPQYLSWICEVTEVCHSGHGSASGKVAFAYDGFRIGEKPDLNSRWDRFMNDEVHVTFTASIRAGRIVREITQEADGRVYEWEPIELDKLRGDACATAKIAMRCEKFERGLSELRSSQTNLAGRVEALVSWAEKGSRTTQWRAPVPTVKLDDVPDTVRDFNAYSAREYIRVVDKKPVNEYVEASRQPIVEDCGLDVVVSSTLFFPPRGKCMEGVTFTSRQFKVLSEFFTTDQPARASSPGRHWQATSRPLQYSVACASPREEFAIQFASYGLFCDALRVARTDRKLRLWPVHLEAGSPKCVCVVGSMIVIRPRNVDRGEESNCHLVRLVLLGHSWSGLVKRHGDGARDHFVYYLRQEDLTYETGDGSCSSVFTRCRGKVSDLMRLRQSSTVVVDDKEAPMEILWRPDPPCEKVHLHPDYAPGRMAFSVPVVFVRTAELVDSVNELCDPEALGYGAVAEEAYLQHKRLVAEVIDSATTAPAWI